MWSPEIFRTFRNELGLISMHEIAKYGIAAELMGRNGTRAATPLDIQTDNLGVVDVTNGRRASSRTMHTTLCICNETERRPETELFALLILGVETKIAYALKRCKNATEQRLESEWIGGYSWGTLTQKEGVWEQLLLDAAKV